MNTFLRRSVKEYARKNKMKKIFEVQNERLFDLLNESGGLKDEEILSAFQNREEVYRLMLMPLVEIAWADGRITTREMEAITQIAEAYGLIEHEPSYYALMNDLMSRPSPQVVESCWEKFHLIVSKLTISERETLGFCLHVQARYVAETSLNSLMSFLRGERLQIDERNAVKRIGEELKKARIKSNEISKENNKNMEKEEKTMDVVRDKADFEKSSEKVFLDLGDEAKELLPLVPLIKVAWAEGQITKRERHLLFSAAHRMGIKPESAAHRKLSEWLEFHPTQEFYNDSLELLSHQLNELNPEEKSLKRLDLLSDCTLIAEASGGGKGFVGGGPRICEEEIAAVKRIAEKLSDRNLAVSA